jgi:hypothetical protein
MNLNNGPSLGTYTFDFGNPGQIRWHFAKEDIVENAPEPVSYFFDDDNIARQCSEVLSPLMADVVDVAVAVHMADRLALRRGNGLLGPTIGWARNLLLQIPVRLPEVWLRESISIRLQRLLQFMTEDEWQLVFVPHSRLKRSSESQEHLFAFLRDVPLRVSLFSGGLDSYSGTANDMAVPQERHFVCISAYSNNRQQHQQRSQLRLLREEFRASVTHVRVPFGMNSSDEIRLEASQRTRGFLFLALGIVTAIAAGTSSLVVHENGIGAINLPYDGSQLGTSNSRSMHPRTLAWAAQLFSELTRSQFRIESPHLFETKAEMCRHWAVRRASAGIPETFSCDGFPNRKKGRPQCGHCTSCLLRRQSLESAGLSPLDTDGYAYDLLSPDYSGPRRCLCELRAMDWQAEMLRRCLAGADPWHRFTLEFPDIRRSCDDIAESRSVSQAEVKQRLLRLYRHYVDDWFTFSARARLTPLKVAA